MSPFGPDDLDAGDKAKPRPRGTLPRLPEDADAEQLRDWLTLAFHPPEGWRIEAFERAGIRREHAANLTVINGREHRKFRFNKQADLLAGRLRPSVLGVSSGLLQMRHLTPSEVEDVWAALCTLGRVLDEQDEPEEARDWVRRTLDVTQTLEGHTLTRPGRWTALMALRSRGEFGYLDARAILSHPGEEWPRRPVRFLDSLTEETWLRAGEVAAYLRYIVGIERLSHGTLRGRMAEIGVRWHNFQDRRPPHPKLTLYRVPSELVAGHEQAP